MLYSLYRVNDIFVLRHRPQFGRQQAKNSAKHNSNQTEAIQLIIWIFVKLRIGWNRFGWISHLF